MPVMKVLVIFQKGLMVEMLLFSHIFIHVALFR